MTTKQPNSFPRSRLLWIGAVAVIAAAAAGAFFLTRKASLTASGTAAALTAQSSGYIDPAECTPCHRDVAATYAKTGMGRSFRKASAANADFARANTVDHLLSGMRYEMVERNGELFERRSTRGSEGQITNVFEERIDYVIGSGNHARTYLHRAANGQLIELPVTWYAEGKGYWAMSPGFDKKSQKDFSRAVKPECLFCHNAYPQGDAGSLNIDTDLDRSIFQRQLPEGIDCQRCHGPGRAHVQAARDGQSSAQRVRETIVNPARLGRERQLEVCMQCHLETSYLEPNEQRAFDRPIFSYRPGEPMADYKLYFLPDAANATDDRFEIAHAAFRLRKSACFQNSQMTCLTCHDPHDIPHDTPNRPEATAHYVQVCQSCHQSVKHTAALPAASTCLTCHMPKRRTDDTVHVVMTDHFIRRTQPKRDLLAPLAEAVVPVRAVTNVALYYPEKPPATPAAEIAMAEARMKNDHGMERLQTLLEHYQPGVPEPYFAVAQEYEREGNETEAARWSRLALQKRGNFEPAIVSLAHALFATNQDAEGTRTLEDGVAQFPQDDLLLSDLGNAYLRGGQPDQAAAVLERAEKVNPERPEPHNLLGVLARGRGDLTTAEQEFREALRCEPNDVQSNDNLGNLLLERGVYKEAAFYFEIAIDADPAFAEAHHHFGRLLVLMDQVPRAVAELKEAARESDGDFQIHEDLADVLAATGHAGEAAAQYTRVLELKPDHPQAQLGLAITLLQQHRPAEARAHLEAAAQGLDAETARRANALLAQQLR
jgi:Flp pilus assembly protein TadD